ncbi:hypothetical protein, partial [Rugamonas sp.]|uniref:hypothetical protein n=1 Tax=Rugamonas sp. TaxID=1926287 RepID=UPI0025CBA2FF
MPGQPDQTDTTDVIKPGAPRAPIGDAGDAAMLQGSQLTRRGFIQSALAAATLAQAPRAPAQPP